MSLSKYLMNNYLKAIWFFIILFFWGVFFKVVPLDFTDFGGDASQYIILAENLASGRGYILTNYPSHPFCLQYPPLFPLFLAPIVFVFGRNFFLMHLLVATFGFFSLFLIYKIIKKYTSSLLALTVIILSVSNYVFVYYAFKKILSDIPFFLFFSLSIFAADKYSEDQNSLGPKAFLFFTAIILGYFCRYVGLIVFLGMAVFFLFQRQYKKLSFTLLTFGFFFALWNIHALFVHDPFTPSHWRNLLLINYYMPEKGTILSHPVYILWRFIDGLNYYFYIIRNVLMPLSLGSGKLGEFLLVYLLSALVILGFIFRFSQDKKYPLPYCFFAYFAMLTLINSPIGGEGLRYILPLIPFLYFYLIAFFQHLFPFSFKKRSGGVLLLTIIFLLININALSLKRSSFSDLPLSIQNFIKLNRWIEKNIPSADIIISRKPRLTFFYSAHKSICYPFSRNPDKIWNFIKKNEVRFIIVDNVSKETYLYILPFLVKYGSHFREIARSGHNWLLQLKK